MPTELPLTLIATAGGPDIRLDRGPISIGRDRDNTIVLADPSVPARAVRLVSVADGWHVTPVDAPVVINGIAIAEPTRLLRGDKLRIGRHLFTVTARGARPSSSPPPRPAGSVPPPLASVAPAVSSPLATLELEPGGGDGRDIELASPSRPRAGTLAPPAAMRATEIELAAVPRTARASVPPVTPHPELRAKAYDDARAQMAWGHPIDRVRRTLVAGGYRADEARVIIADLLREEHAVTRGKGLRQVAASVASIAAGLGLYALFGMLRVGSMRFGVIALLLVVGGAIGALHGLSRLLLGGRERHDITG